MYIYICIFLCIYMYKYIYIYIYIYIDMHFAPPPRSVPNQSDVSGIRSPNGVLLSCWRSGTRISTATSTWDPCSCLFWSHVTFTGILPSTRFSYPSPKYSYPLSQVLFPPLQDTFPPSPRYSDPHS